MHSAQLTLYNQKPNVSCTHGTAAFWVSHREPSSRISHVNQVREWVWVSEWGQLPSPTGLYRVWGGKPVLIMHIFQCTELLICLPYSCLSVTLSYKGATKIFIFYIRTVHPLHKQRAWRKVSMRIKVTLLFVEIFMSFRHKEWKKQKKLGRPQAQRLNTALWVSTEISV